MAFTLPGSAVAAGARGIRQTSADAMASLPSISNVGKDYEGLSPAPGHVPSAWEQMGTEALNDQVSTALGASPAIQALRRAADERRSQAHEDEYQHEVDLAGGGPGRIAGMEADIEGKVGGQLARYHALTQFDPMVEALHARERGEKTQDLGMQYVTAPGVKAAGDLAVAQATAKGHVDAANAAHQLLSPDVAYQQGLIKRFGEGYPLQDKNDPNTSPDAFAQYLGAQPHPIQPPGPGTSPMSALLLAARQRYQQPQQPPQ